MLWQQALRLENSSAELSCQFNRSFCGDRCLGRKVYENTLEASLDLVGY